MTVVRLNRILEGFIARGHGRLPVYINKLTFTDPLEQDGAVVIGIKDCEIHRIELLDGDGFTKTRKSGTSCSKLTVVMFGEEQ